VCLAEKGTEVYSSTNSRFPLVDVVSFTGWYQSVSQASLISPNASAHPKARANHRSVPAGRASPASSTDRDILPSRPPLGPTPEEGEEKLDDEEGETSKQPMRTGRRSEGTMNRSFKFPPDPIPSGAAPPVPNMPKDLPVAARKPKPIVEDKRARKSNGSNEVAMVAPSSMEVPPPPPTENEGTTSSVSDLDDVGETKEILLH